MATGGSCAEPGRSAPPWNIPRGAPQTSRLEPMGGVPMRNDRRPVCRAAGRQQKQALAGLRAVLGRNGCGGRWFADPFWQTVPSTGSRRVLDAMMLERGRMVAESLCSRSGAASGISQAQEGANN
jgi:hypothetical protein